MKSLDSIHSGVVLARNHIGSTLVKFCCFNAENRDK